MKAMTAMLAGLALSAAALPAGAYCIHNDLKDRSVSALQEDHPNEGRNESRLKATLKPGAQACCETKNMDCNPNGRQNSLVGIAVTVEGGTPLKCGPTGVPEKAKLVKISGAGTMRVVPNPRFNPKVNDGAAPYIVRVWAHDKQDITGPAGLPCR
jgi:hypothetical protein